MHGALLVRDKKSSYRLDARYAPRDCKVIGHNKIEVGTWWPRQVIALFNGAHGSMIGGIAGSEQRGAFVSAHYDGLDFNIT